MVKSGDKVQCIDKGNNIYIDVGTIYTVKKFDGSRYVLHEIPDHSYPARLFKLVETTVQDTPISNQSIVSPTTDLSDWKVWRDHGRLPGHCVCEILQSQCKYHKDAPI